MILIFLLIAAFIFAIFFGIVECSFSEGLASFVGMAMVAVMLTVLICCGTWGELEIESTDKIEIHALVDNASYSGTISNSVFLIRGHINETLKYQYMYYKDGYGWTLGEAHVRQSYLNYTSENPYLEIINYKYKDDFLQWLIPYIGDCEYRFFLPSNAEIIDDFVIDLN